MCCMLLSINPVHVENIMNGNKEYEFRKRACKRHIDKILIYSTMPVMKVVGEAEVEDILIDAPNAIWTETAAKAGIEKSFFDEYFKNRNQAVAYKLTNVTKYKEPKDLVEFGVKTAPQSYQYVEAV